ncbi:MAG: ASKHA domain-containing protein [Clostridia bacterium]|nr:ASKHA domain-containing protein [Clostridia bacterium]
MKYSIRVHKKGKIKELKAEEGTNLLRFLNKHSEEVASPCGGKGTCGKCRVRVEGLSGEPQGKEKKLLGSSWISKGYRLACYQEVNADLDLYLDQKEEKAKIITASKERKIKIEPVIIKETIQLAAPDIHDQISDLERVKNAGEFKTGLSLELIRQLPDTLRKENFRVTLVYLDNKLISVEAGDTTAKNLGLAIDIGTTTIAAYLLDLNTGKQLGVYSLLNPQRQFGADVLSRISYAVENKKGMEELHKSLIRCVNDIIEYFESTLNIQGKDIYAATFAGNTTMLHFLMKLPVQNISVAPFIPATTEMHKITARELGIKVNSNGYIYILPAVSAYVGADTVMAVLSSEMYRKEEISLLVDLGTNGEIVLGNNQWMVACSTAAGPAFEGANIRSGIGGVEGAIDKVSVNPVFSYGTIGNKQAVGICGSGIVDAIGGLFTAGVIEGTGRVLSREELKCSRGDIKERLLKLEGMNSFVLDESVDQQEPAIVLTQRDVRELQNAKAAVAAGIKILAKEANIKLSDIDRVYLAGGFGSCIDIENALIIGLLPSELKGKIESIGNAAGAGAVECLLSAKILKKAQKIKESIRYIELSSSMEFMDEYVDCMGFDA